MKPEEKIKTLELRRGQWERLKKTHPQFFNIVADILMIEADGGDSSSEVLFEAGLMGFDKIESDLNEYVIKDAKERIEKLK